MPEQLEYARSERARPSWSGIAIDPSSFFALAFTVIAVLQVVWAARAVRLLLRDDAFGPLRVSFLGRLPSDGYEAIVNVEPIAWIPPLLGALFGEMTRRSGWRRTGRDCIGGSIACMIAMAAMDIYW